MSEKVVLRDPRPTKIVELPSFKGSQIEIWPSALFRDLEESNQNNPEKTGFALIPKMIKSWNFTDDSGNDLPIEEETIKSLPADDIVFLMQEISTFAAEQKKN